MRLYTNALATLNLLGCRSFAVIESETSNNICAAYVGSLLTRDGVVMRNWSGNKTASMTQDIVAHMYILDQIVSA